MTPFSREMPHGISIVSDIARRFPNYRVNIIFDVGANVGQSASMYITSYPSSTVFCFEPIAETYQELKLNMQGKNQISCFQLAFGASEGKGCMTSEGTSTMNCLVDENTISDSNVGKTEWVDISTLDDFCRANEIDHISYLKIDTEGGDLDVLKGAQNMLITKSVDLLEVEAGMNPNNKHHVPFESLKNYLEKHGYFIFGIYEQVSEWPENKPHLRRTNTVFISDKMICNNWGQVHFKLSPLVI